jgi:hypothetical protein
MASWHRRILVGLLLALLPVSWRGARAEEPRRCPIYQPLVKVTSAERWLSEVGGAVFGEGNEWTEFTAAGEFNRWGMLRGHCLEKGRLTFSRNTVSGGCRYRMDAPDGEARFKVSRTLTVTDAAPDVMLATLVWSGGSPQRGVWRRELDYSEQQVWFWGEAPLIQIVAGAKDRSLLEAVERELQRPSDRGDCPPLFRGPPAQSPRLESEIYFSNPGARPEAERVAALLEKLLGKVPVQPWPGEWRYDVVIVVGSKAIDR